MPDKTYCSTGSSLRMQAPLATAMSEIFLTTHPAPMLDFAHLRYMADGVCDTDEAVGWYFLLVWGISRP